MEKKGKEKRRKRNTVKGQRKVNRKRKKERKRR